MLAASPLPWLVTTDMLLEGAHFRLAEAGAFRVGRKVMAVNLSDIAAMAGRPVAAVASVGLPRHGAGDIAQSLYDGMRSMTDAFDTALVGGDTNTWDGGLAVSVTLLGQPTPPGPVPPSGRNPAIGSSSRARWEAASSASTWISRRVSAKPCNYNNVPRSTR